MESDLEMANRHVAEGEARCARQELLIGRMAERGQNIDLAVQLLDGMTETLHQMRIHRDEILRREQMQARQRGTGGD